ncbi:MAG TPA: NUDIX domain-containing protein [Burkholderiaceae bacterium]|nr:NUDIX domain-containing protein [Burkholderiaceae bacterium]
MNSLANADAPVRAVVDVAVGVVLKPDGRFLLGSRPEGKPYAGYWEFPGGKFEPGETPAQALARELREELAIEIDDALPWVTIEHVYTHAHVRLHFMRVTRWRGEPRACEGQEFGWFDLNAHRPEPLLPAAYPCLAWMALPTVMPRSSLREGATVHSREDIARAYALGLDYVVLEADAATFPTLARQAPLPVYARAHVFANLRTAMEAGAHGIVE